MTMLGSLVWTDNGNGNGNGNGFRGYAVDEASAYSSIDLKLAGWGDDELSTFDTAILVSQCEPTPVQAN